MIDLFSKMAIADEACTYDYVCLVGRTRGRKWVGSAEVISMKAQSVGISYCNHIGRLTSTCGFKATTNASNDIANGMTFTRSATGTDITAQFDARNAILLYLTDGQCQPCQLSTVEQYPLQVLDYEI